MRLGRSRHGVRGLFQPRRTASRPPPRATCCSSRSTRSARIVSAATAAATSRRRPRSAGRRRGARARRDGPRAAHPAVARLALHRPLSRGARIRDNIAPRSPRMCRRWRRSCRRGFQDGALVSSIVLSAQSGLNRGFGTYSARFEAGADDARFLTRSNAAVRTRSPTRSAGCGKQDLGVSRVCISTSRMIHTSRRSPTCRGATAGRMTARSRGPTSSSDGCSARSNPLAPLRRPS